ncbi:hypothetical protein Slala03_11210 [Streptomyces lavendulae subsp. lavendulae]|nr:hypothetical protein Slala03_11210 [Streptomyces lavendulae subsp. lavendulae]
MPQEAGRVTELRRGLGALRLQHIGDQHPAAAVHDGLRGRRAEAPGPTGDDDDLAAQIHNSHGFTPLPDT